jgi:hypothetical protein
MERPHSDNQFLMTLIEYQLYFLYKNMPHPKLKLDQKYDNANKQIKNVIKKYDDRDHLSILVSDYRKNNSATTKLAYSDRHKCISYERIVHSYSEVNII